MEEVTLKSLIGNIDEISKLNDSLFEKFQLLYLYIITIKRENKKKNYIEDKYYVENEYYVEDEFLEIFFNYDKRNIFLYENINLIENIAEEEISKKIVDTYNEYFRIESKILSNKKETQKYFSFIEKSINNFRNNNIEERDFKILELCIKYAYNRYKTNNFEEEFSFYSDSINKSKYYRGFNVNFSIDNKKIWHLLELPGFFKNLKKSYDVYIDNDINVEDFIFSSKSFDLIKKYLLNLPLNDIEEKIIKNYENRFERKNSETIKKDLRTEIALMISKNINFSKVYEYKLIPEIILGYDTPEINYDPNSYENSKNKEYNYYSSSSANTPIKSDKKQKLMNIDYNELNEENKKIYDSINKEFEHSDLIVYVDSDNKIIGLYDSKLNIEFKIYFEKGKYIFKSNFNPNLFIVSYDKEDIYDDLSNNETSIYYALYFTLIDICKELDLSYEDIKDFSGKLNINEIDFDIKSENDIVKNIIDKKSKHNLNIELFISLLLNISKTDYDSYDFINDKNNLGQKSNVIKEMLKKLKQNKKQKEEYDRLKEIIKIAFQQNIRTDELKEEVIGYSANGSNIPNFGIFVPLIQKLNEISGKDIYHEKNIGCIGYCIRFNNDETLNNDSVIELYPKTFMPKNISQLVGDLRINGTSFLLDTIYDTKTKKVYNTILISEKEPQLKISIQEQLEEIVSRKNKGMKPKK